MVIFFCCREQYIFNVFEVIVSTLETKLQRIENLDKAVEHLMRRVEALDSRVNDNIDKTDDIISKLRTIDLKLFPQQTSSSNLRGTIRDFTVANTHKDKEEGDTLDMRLVSLDQKVSDIDSKLVGLKNQIDSNFLPVDDINAEASEKKPISMNVLEITKAMNAEVINHITKELEQLRTATGNVDRKLQFHINLVSENLGKVLTIVSEVHTAVMEPEVVLAVTNSTAPHLARHLGQTSKIDNLVQRMLPIITVSEKMDEVWDVVVGTKSSVDDLVPKSNELLSQNIRQERAIGQIHDDLNVKANLIIERLKKQEVDAASLSGRPVPSDLLLDPTIDRLVEYDLSRYSGEEPPIATTAATTTTTTSDATTTMTSSSTDTRSDSTGAPPLIHHYGHAS